MKLKLKYLLNVKPDKNGEYPEALAKLLINRRLAVIDKSKKRETIELL